MSAIGRTLVRDLRPLNGHEAEVSGFVFNVRVLKRMVFVVLRDRTGQVQITVDRETNRAASQIAETLTVGSAVTAHGVVNVSEAVKSGGVELLADRIDAVSRAEPVLPIEESSAPDLQLDWRFVALRRPRNWLLFEIQTTIEHAMRAFWSERGFIELHSPKLMHSASESGSETFSVDYFDLGKAYLAQSPQFYKQMAMAAGFDRVFEIGPVFRAEPSMTVRHATEFTSVDVEISWIRSHDDVMRLEEDWVRFILSMVRERHGADIARDFGVNVVVPPERFPRVTMADAHRRLAGAGHAIPLLTKPGDIGPEGERLLAKMLLEERGSEFYFLTDYPAGLRPFYHMRDDENPEITKSFDLLWNGTEITTGAQREHRHDRLVRQAQAAGLRESVSYYLDFFRFGCPPHGGFGFGLARFIMLLLNLSSVREAVFLHRSPHRLTP
jgi:nondiscriminating aspartyl-tRNA synthetase